MKVKDSNIYIADILDATKRLKSYTANKTFDDFQGDTLLQDAVAYNLEIIGEASRRLPSELKQDIDLPWDDISGMRNKIAHDYFELNEEVVWRAATEDVLELERKLLPYNPEQ